MSRKEGSVGQEAVNMRDRNVKYTGSKAKRLRQDVNTQGGPRKELT